MRRERSTRSRRASLGKAAGPAGGGRRRTRAVRLRRLREGVSELRAPSSAENCADGPPRRAQLRRQTDEYCTTRGSACCWEGTSACQGHSAHGTQAASAVSVLGCLLKPSGFARTECAGEVGLQTSLSAAATLRSCLPDEGAEFRASQFMS